MKTLVKRLITMSALGGVLIFGLAPAASAHPAQYAPYGAYAPYYRYEHVRPIPRWVRADRGFHRWYLRSRYRHVRHLSWHRLFELYRYDAHYHGHRRHGHEYTDRYGRRIRSYR